MKKEVLFLDSLHTLMLLVFRDDNDDHIDTIDITATPKFTSLENVVSSLLGEDFIFQPTVAGLARINSVNRKYTPWFLGKTVVADNTLATYDFSYAIKEADDIAANNSHRISITVTNGGSNCFY